MAQTDKDYNSLADNDPLGDLRALIPDTERLADPAHPDAGASYLFDDSSLKRYLRLSGATAPSERDGVYTASPAQVYRAAAHACEALGSSEMLVLKKITSEDLATDGATLANQYGAKAKRLRDEAQKLDEADEDEGGGFFLHPFVPRPAGFDAEALATRRSWGFPW